MRSFLAWSWFAVFCVVAIGAATFGARVALAASPGSGPDVLGIRLGMPLREAYAVLQAANPNKKLETAASNYPSIDKPVLSMFALGFAPANSVENIQVNLTPPPDHQVVYRVRHHLGMQKMFRGNVLSSLREKYGQEALQTNAGHQMWWVYDEQGKPASLPSSANPPEVMLEDCVTRAPGYGNSGWFGVGSIQNNMNNINSAAWCVSFGIIVHASFGGPGDIVDTLDVDMVDVPLAVRSGKSEMTWLASLGKAQEQRQVDDSKQNKPKL
jgi:hypothetical protein